MLIWTAGWSIAIRRVDVLHDKILWSGRERVGENTQKKFQKWRIRKYIFVEWNGKIKKKYSIEYHNYNERYWFTINQHTSCHTKKTAKKSKHVFSFRTVNVYQVQNIYGWYKPYHWCHHGVSRWRNST